MLEVLLLQDQSALVYDVFSLLVTDYTSACVESGPHLLARFTQTSCLPLVGFKCVSAACLCVGACARAPACVGVRVEGTGVGSEAIPNGNRPCGGTPDNGPQKMGVGLKQAEKEYQLKTINHMCMYTYMGVVEGAICLIGLKGCPQERP